MPDRIPPNLEDAWRTELAGLEQRLIRADDTQRPALEARVASLRANLGENAPAPVRARRKANGAEYRPGGEGAETA